jgi:hypothetical protein
MGMTMNRKSAIDLGLDRLLACAAPTKAATIALGILLTWLYFSAEESAQALNGYTYVSICSCATTGDFVAAAETTAVSYHDVAGGSVVGTYSMISTTTARTAYIQVTGQGVLSQGHYTWVVTAAIPINSSGASIASETESEQEAFYGALDQTLLGVNRSGPLTANCPDSYSESFINSIDEEVGPGIDLALSQEGVSWAGIPIGTVITVNFSDGTTAQYIKTNNSTDHWAWNGVAHNKSGQPINRNGTVQTNPNTAGTGGGSVTPPGFGSGSTWTWLYTGGNDCYYSSYVTLPDGTDFGGGGWGPC